MKASVLFAGAVLLFAGAAAEGSQPSKHIHEDVDPYSGQRNLTLEIDTDRCLAESTPDANPARVRLLLTATSAPNGGATFAVTVDLTGGHLIHPGRHASMDTLADGVAAQLYPLSEKTKWTERNAFTGSKHIREVIPFGVSPEYLRVVSGAKTFRFRVNATDTVLERCVNAHELRDLPEFLGQASTF